MAYCAPEERYHIAESQRTPVNISNWTYANRTDPALKDFQLNLQNHALGRLSERFSEDLRTAASQQELQNFTFEDRSRLIVYRDQLYPHQMLRLNYTTYDLRRSQDIQPPEMAQRVQSTHFSMLGSFHINVRLSDSAMVNFERMDILFVRWFCVDHSKPGGFKAKRLHRVEFVPCDDDTEPAFGFIDPSHVVRASHILPAFASGRTADLLPPSLARDIAGISNDADKWHTDFCYHYINFFVDRDIFMRYYGGGIGHRGNTSTRPSQVALDDDELGSEWEDVDNDLAQAQAEEELVPEITEAGGVHAALLKEIESRQQDDEFAAVHDEDEMFSGEDEDWDADDPARDDLVGTGDFDQYDLEGIALL
ncbi:hypothetical protein C8Q80DRAFT_1125441 [Daedaleopsis nitida]|nr:hypothetical protein C8Q80DRAFT_1125441 [Daedaleopsis nitida]